MIVQTAAANINDQALRVILVASEFTEPEAGDAVLRLAQRHFPTEPILLVSIQPNGFRSHSTFRAHTFLALLQLEQLSFSPIDLAAPPEQDDPPF